MTVKELREFLRRCSDDLVVTISLDKDGKSVVLSDVVSEEHFFLEDGNGETVDWDTLEEGEHEGFPLNAITFWPQGS